MGKKKQTIPIKKLIEEDEFILDDSQVPVEEEEVIPQKKTLKKRKVEVVEEEEEEESVLSLEDGKEEEEDYDIEEEKNKKKSIPIPIWVKDLRITPALPLAVGKLTKTASGYDFYPWTSNSEKILLRTGPLTSPNGISRFSESSNTWSISVMVPVTDTRFNNLETLLKNHVKKNCYTLVGALKPLEESNIKFCYTGVCTRKIPKGGEAADPNAPSYINFKIFTQGKAPVTPIFDLEGNAVDHKQVVGSVIVDIVFTLAYLRAHQGKLGISLEAEQIQLIGVGVEREIIKDNLFSQDTR